MGFLWKPQDLDNPMEKSLNPSQAWHRRAGNCSMAREAFCASSWRRLCHGPAGHNLVMGCLRQATGRWQVRIGCELSTPHYCEFDISL